jgi:hypothetical protein
MASFEEGHTTNVGKTYQAAKVKRIMKRRSREAEEKMLASLMPADLLPAMAPKRKKRLNTHPNTLANLRTGVNFFKSPNAHKKKRTGSIKDKITSELTKKGQIDGLYIARRLINMAKAGDLRAIEIIMERMDGKVPTSIGGDKDNPLIIQVEPVIKARYENKNVNSGTDNNRPGFPQVPGN